MLSARSERGAAAIMVALVTCVVLFVAAALTVDIGNSWARRGQLQFQVDRAAKFAAEKLPVDTTTVAASPSSSQLAVARAAAYYMACHAVAGQDDLSSIPSCPANGADYTADPGIRAFATSLLDNGRTSSNASLGAITFPAVNKVAIRAPDALVSFGFGRAVGADGTTQSRSATAVVLSPGDLLPIGLSVTCLAAAIGAAPLGTDDTVSKVVPVNYVSTGYPTQSGSVPVEELPYTPGDTDWADVTGVYNNHPASIDVNVTLSSVSPSGQVTVALDWTSGKTGFTVESIHIYIRLKGYVVGDPYGFYEVDLAQSILDYGKQSGTATVSLNLPQGDYEAMIRLSGRNGGAGALQHWINNSNQNAEFRVPDTGRLSNLVSCARPLQSPRLGFSSPGGDGGAMAVNIAQHVDHAMAAFPGLGNAVDGVAVPTTTAVASVPGLLGTADSAFRCDANPRVKLDYPARRDDGANCVRVDTTQDWSDSLTRGLLTGGTLPSGGSYAGRLKCPSSGSCNASSARAVLASPGGISGTYNNDKFEDFITDASVLNDPFLMSLDSFISPSLPLITPPSTAVDDALYDSPRFFWAPIVLTTYVTSAPGAAADYSILSFRPVFLTGDSPSSTAVSPVDTLLLGLIQSAQASGYGLQSVLRNFADNASSLNPCAGTTVTLLSLLTVTLSASNASACELAMLKTRLYSSTTASTTTVARFIHRYLGSNIAVSDSANTGSFGGLVIDKSAARVRAARIMTIAPGALPAVAQNYNGPTTDYLGVGPKIIRLTK